MDVQVRPIAPNDRAEWAALFAAYRDFYELQPDDAIVDRVWSWLMNAEHEVSALVAVDADVVVGVAHYRPFCRPSMGTTGLYLDDLFTAPDVRARGVGRSLIGALSELAAAEGRSTVRWMTSEWNMTARMLYDRVATQTQWVTYEVNAGPLPTTR
jgi:GNAT superfamily N-acetyltransferase